MPHEPSPSGEMPPVSVVIPAFNEEKAVGPEIQSIRKVLVEKGIVHEIIIVDDASQDNTAAQALAEGVRVLQHPENRGYGASIKTGILAARYDVIAITDADGTYPADQLPILISKLQVADMVVGARVGSEVHIPWIRRPAKWVLRKLAAHIAGKDIPDLNSGLRVFRREVIQQYFSILSDRFSFTTTSTLALLGDNYQVTYHPINYYKRVGQSKIRPRHFMDFTVLVLRMAMLFQPLKVFLPLAYIGATLGLLKSVFDVALVVQRAAQFGMETFYQPILSTSSLLLLLAAMQFLFIGMVADGVLRRMAQHTRPLVLSRAIGSNELGLGQRETNR